MMNPWKTKFDPPDSTARWRRFIAACGVVVLVYGTINVHRLTKPSDHVTVTVEGQGTVAIPREPGESVPDATRRYAMQRRLAEQTYDPAEVFEQAAQHPGQMFQIWPPVPSRCRSIPNDCWANQQSPFSSGVMK